jgi:dephospho-CoA kinase
MSFKKTIILGLTGSIGMGKTTTAQMFLDYGIPVWDADTTVHQLYKDDEKTIKIFRDKIPQVVLNNQVNREALKNLIIEDKENLKKIEEIIHPLVADHRADFLSKAKERKIPLVVLDIPLLFEKGNETIVDYVVVVTVDAKTQKKRVLDRNTMSEEMLDSILEKQMPDEEKRTRADFIIPTRSMVLARGKVKEIISNFVGS